MVTPGLRRVLASLAAAGVLTCLPTLARGADLAFRAGEGDRVRSAAAAMQWALLDSLPCTAACTARLHLQGGVGYWWLPYDSSGDSLWDWSLTPMLIIANGKVPAPVALELGVGVHYFSHDALASIRNFGSRWQWGEFIGAAFPLGQDPGKALTVRLEHVSNGGFAAPNNGVTFLSVGLRFRLGGAGP